ncbi:MAG TPA: cytochrome c oxidase subunit II [Terriglobia bacterium]|nr:cytochrome c oxidase subunit II [Terriglobia bacterium]
MADGNGHGRITIAGLAFAFLMLVLIIVSLWLFIGRPWWFPELASVRGGDIDGVFSAVLIVTGIAFVGVQGILGYFVARYGSRGTERAGYWHDNPKAEAGLLIGTAVIMTILVFMGQRVWASIYFTDAPPGTMEVQVTGQQFAWNFHYAGPDGVFGRTDAKLITTDGTNEVGLDRKDPAAKDDIVVTNEMHVVVGKPVKVRLRSKDVIHSFFLPNMRVKQDAVPGMSILVWLEPTRAGEFELACAELCGAQHYRMKARLIVEKSEQDLNNWIKSKQADQAGN